MKRFVVICALFLGLCGIVGAQQPAFTNISVEEFDKLRKQPNVGVIDVRSPKEFATGHIPGAINMDWIAGEFFNKVGGLDKRKIWLVHCAAGARSGKAVDKMATLKFTTVYNLPGGIKAWEKAGKPIEK